MVPCLPSMFTATQGPCSRLHLSGHNGTHTLPSKSETAITSSYLCQFPIETIVNFEYKPSLLLNIECIQTFTCPNLLLEYLQQLLFAICRQNIFGVRCFP